MAVDIFIGGLFAKGGGLPLPDGLACLIGGDSRGVEVVAVDIGDLAVGDGAAAVVLFNHGQGHIPKPYVGAVGGLLATVVVVDFIEQLPGAVVEECLLRTAHDPVEIFPSGRGLQYG